MRRALRRLRIPALGLLVLLSVGAVGLAERGLRELETFRVRRVVVTGTRLLEPYAVVRAAGLTTAASVFDDEEAWRAGILTLPLVRDVRIRRSLPATVQLVVAEVEPVALVPGPQLRALDGSGWVLPVDPAGLDLDLPLLGGVEVRAGRLAREGDAGAALDALMALRRDAPELAERVSQIERGGGMLRVVFRDEAAEVLLPLDASGLQVRQLRLAFGDLASRGELSRVRRIDLRFRDQVVVSFLSSPVS